MSLLRSLVVFTFVAVAYAASCNEPAPLGSQLGQLVGVTQGQVRQSYFYLYNNTIRQVERSSGNTYIGAYKYKTLPLDAKYLFAYLPKKSDKEPEELQMYHMTKDNEVYIYSAIGDSFPSMVDTEGIIVQDLTLLLRPDFSVDPMLAISGQDKSTGAHLVLVYKLQRSGLPEVHARLSTPRKSRRPVASEIVGGQYDPKSPAGNYASNGFYVAQVINSTYVQVYNCIDGYNGQKCKEFSLKSQYYSITKGSIFAVVEHLSVSVSVLWVENDNDYMYNCGTTKCQPADAGIRLNPRQVFSFYNAGRIHHWIMTSDGQKYIMSCSDVHCKHVTAQYHFTESDGFSWGDLRPMWGVGSTSYGGKEFLPFLVMADADPEYELNLCDD